MPDITILDELMLPVELDRLTMLQAENDKLTRIIQADDVIEIQAELINSKNRSRLCLVDNFADVMKDNLTCKNKPKIIGYKHIKNEHRITINGFFHLTEKSGYAPVYELINRFDEYTTIHYCKNKLSIKIVKLSHFDKSRYRTLICVLQESGLFTYNQRTDNPTEKHIYNTFRQVLLRKFYIVNYEYGLFFNPEISRALLKPLARISKKVVGNTHYLHDGKRITCKVKVYNIDAAIRQDQTANWIEGDRLKFEVTFRHQFFRNQSDLTLNRFTYQNEIVYLLHEKVKELLNKHLIVKLNPDEKRRLITAANVKTIGEFMSILSDDKTTQISTDRRLKSIEEQIKSIKEVQARIETRQDNIDNQVQDNTERLDKLESFVDYQNSKQDSRKLRSVK